MTPLILNLLAEENQAEHASARDPVKIAIVGAITLVVLTISVGVFISYLASGRQDVVGEMEKRYEKLTGAQSSGKFRQLVGFSDSLSDARDKRVLIAPQLARIKDIVPPRIHLNSIMFHVSIEVSGGAPATEGGKPTKPRETQRLTLRLEGEAVGARSSIEVDKYLETLRTDPLLTSQMQEVTLRSIGSAPFVEGQDSRVSRTQFVIECLYKEIK